MAREFQYSGVDVATSVSELQYSCYFTYFTLLLSCLPCTVQLIRRQIEINTNTNDNVYGAVIMARPLREFTRFI